MKYLNTLVHSKLLPGRELVSLRDHSRARDSPQHRFFRQLIRSRFFPRFFGYGDVALSLFCEWRFECHVARFGHVALSFYCDR